MNDIGKLKSRHKKVAYYGVPKTVEGVTTVTFYRMTGFTSLPQNKNPKEHTRQYVDEDFERSDIVGYAPVIPYNFDRHDGNKVHEDIVNITDNELIGADAVRIIIVADLDDSTAIQRNYSVIPDGEGDDINIYTYSGNFKANSEKVMGTATSSDNWQTITFTESVTGTGTGNP